MGSEVCGLRNTIATRHHVKKESGLGVSITWYRCRTTKTYEGNAEISNCLHGGSLARGPVMLNTVDQGRPRRTTIEKMERIVTGTLEYCLSCGDGFSCGLTTPTELVVSHDRSLNLRTKVLNRLMLGMGGQRKVAGRHTFVQDLLPQFWGCLMLLSHLREPQSSNATTWRRTKC